MVEFLFGHTLKTQLGSEPKVLVDGKLLNEQVVLRYETNQVLGLRLADVVPIDSDGAFLWLHTAIEQGEQGSLTCSRTTHDCQQFTIVEGKA